MKTAQQWFDLYGESHRHPTNKAIHWVCVPLILCTSLGLIQAIPHPFPAPIHWGWVAALGMLGFYGTLSRTLLLGMFVALAACLAVNHALAAVAPLAWVSAGVWGAAWLAQFVGHEIEGKKPSFFQDVQYLLVGPAWLLHFVYQRAGCAGGRGRFVTAAAFRALALSLPGASEAPHMQRTAFRVGGRIFATLAGDGTDAMVKLKPLERVHALLTERPDLCFSFGGWTMKLGCLGLRLPEASEADVEALMREAWRELAPKRLRG